MRGTIWALCCVLIPLLTAVGCGAVNGALPTNKLCAGAQSGGSAAATVSIRRATLASDTTAAVEVVVCPPGGVDLDNALIDVELLGATDDGNSRLVLGQGTRHYETLPAAGVSITIQASGLNSGVIPDEVVAGLYHADSTGNNQLGDAIGQATSPFPVEN